MRKGYDMDILFVTEHPADILIPLIMCYFLYLPMSTTHTKKFSHDTREL